MRSRINSTRRLKIDPAMAAFNVTQRIDGSAEFHANINLSALKLPKEGEVIVEAYRQNLHERFPFGTVASPAPAEGTVLRELGTDGLQFRVKVVEPGSGRLLARGDRLGAAEEEESGRRSLLKVITRDLDHEPWKTELHGGRPVLVLNDHIPGVLAQLSTDPVFRSLVLPGALRQVLLMMCIEKVEDREDDDGDDGDDEGWASDWIRFAEKISGEDKPDWTDIPAVHGWVDKVCREFSARFDLTAAFEQD
jgi:hypothetical protein